MRLPPLTRLSILKGWTSSPGFVYFLRERLTLGVFFERLSFNVERRGMENKYSGMLAWEEGISYL